MTFKSITSKLLTLIIGTFLLTMISVLLTADYQLVKIIDKNQKAIYQEKIEAIWNTLNRMDINLQKTGLIDAYIEEFQEYAVKELVKEFYEDKDLSIYPFILDKNLNIIMHPTLSNGDKFPGNNLFQIKKNKLNTLLNSSKNLYLKKYFKPWGWVIHYTVPLSYIYNESRMLLNILFIIIVSISLIALIILSIILYSFTRPIRKLTSASIEISKGNLDAKINTVGEDEISILASNFEEMRSSIKQKVLDLKQEIKERKLAEDELKKAKNFIKNIVDSMPSILIGVDVNGDITQWNIKAENEIGVSSSMAMGQPLDKIIPRLSSEVNRVKDSIKSKKGIIDVKQSTQINGKKIYENITIYPLIANGIQGAVIRIDDITEKVRLEEMMIQSEKMMSIGGLAAGMAHEINNPLAGIIQNGNVLTNRLGKNLNMKANIIAAQDAGTSIESIQTFMENRKIFKILDSMSDSCKRVASVVSNMLSFARKGDNKITYQNINILLDKTLELAATDYDLKKQFDFKRITIHKEYDYNLPNILCDPIKIQQVILNLCRNGAQALQDGKTKEPIIYIRTKFLKEDSYVIIEIEDNGPGMKEEIKKRIFEPFFTTKPAGIGTGLGLSVSYFIITESHSGKMSVESSIGKGSKFIISLPHKPK